MTCNAKKLLNDALRKAEDDAKFAEELMDTIFGEDFKMIPRFEFVDFEQFKSDWIAAFDGFDEDDKDDIVDIYDELKLPRRATASSAGYDLFSPVNFYVKPGDTIMIPTGIRVLMPKDMVFMIHPRSGLGTKFRFVPCNLTGIIDADYAEADNQGHIHMMMVNNGDKIVTIEKGQAFCQGVFSKYYTTYNDTASKSRLGGFGHTDNR